MELIITRQQTGNMADIINEPQLFTIDVKNLQIIQTAFSFDFFQQRNMGGNNNSFSKLVNGVTRSYELSFELITAFFFLR